MKYYLYLFWSQDHFIKSQVIRILNQESKSVFSFCLVMLCFYNNLAVYIYKLFSWLSLTARHRCQTEDPGYSCLLCSMGLKLHSFYSTLSFFIAHCASVVGLCGTIKQESVLLKSFFYYLKWFLNTNNIYFFIYNDSSFVNKSGRYCWVVCPNWGSLLATVHTWWGRD